jgi:molecular chaperone GrpE
MENNVKQKSTEKADDIKVDNNAADEPKKNDQKKVLTTEEKLKESEDKLLRTLAEMENQRRRFEKEIKDAFEFGGFNFAKEVLALIDNLQRAKISIKTDETLKDSKDLSVFIKNIEVIEKNLILVFEKNNIKKITCLNQKFDPNLHQAMLEIEDESSETGMVLQEIQPGYMFASRLLRPSFVGVSKKKQTKTEQKDEKK